MTKYEDLIKKRKNKDTSVDEIAKKYKMGVMDVKIMQEWKEKYEKEHKLRQEAETETILVKGIGMNSPEMKAAKNEINDLKNKIADLTDSLTSKDYFREPDYKYLIEENQRLEQERNELLVVNKRLNRDAEEKLDRARKAGL
jgi:hypothetical protein